MERKVLVTGATGNVGREVARALRARGVPVRAASSSASMSRQSDIEAVTLDFRNAATFAPAVRGCSSVFLLRPPAIAKVKGTLGAFIDVARDSGVEHIVFLSVAGADKNKLVPHHAVEAHLAAHGPSATVLRPGFFAQNLGDAYRRDIAEDDRLYVPAGDGLVTFVDVRDIADVAVLALLEPERHRGRAYTLTGPAPVSFGQAARLLTQALGRPIRYVPASIPGYMRNLRRRNLPWGQVAVQTVLHVGLRFGQAAAVDPTLESLLGRPGRTLRQYIDDHVALWQRD